MCQQLGQTKVQEFDGAAPGDEDVVRFDVAVEGSPGMGRFQSFANL